MTVGEGGFQSLDWTTGKSIGPTGKAESSKKTSLGVNPNIGFPSRHAPRPSPPFAGWGRFINNGRSPYCYDRF